ncbi:short-chain dehydrogenase [Variovorax sp. RT4R15]|uniref:short-chain dehydrogenase n=1 Tax=Variovorax sp. RT4R15 TaxID=3443737 RepID=UPI003F46DF2C
MHSQHSLTRTPASAPPRPAMVTAVARHFGVLSQRRNNLNAQLQQERLNRLDPDQRVRETGEW